MSTEQILGLITGLAFGFLLQRGRVLRYDKQVAAMLFKDMAIFKFMLSAIVIGMFGILAFVMMCCWKSNAHSGIQTGSNP